jgi:hypothetical protein
MAVPRLCELYPAIYLTSEEKARKTSVKVAARTSQADSTIQGKWTVKYTNEKQ